ncbi:restriction endonuclease subunit S, partial [Glaesserella parasuis]|nr:restriction endonuclease subunit S [Glaesserella parasuis]
MSKLGDFINVKHGFAFKGEFITTKVNNNCLVTPGNFAIGGGFKSDKFKFYTGEIPREYILEENDLIVTMTDLSKEADTLGYSALVPKIENKIMLHNQRIGLIELKNKNIDKEYLYFLLRSKEYRHHIVSSATGSTVKHTSPSRILSFEFECPSLEYQQWAAKQLMDIERKIQLNTQINQTLEQIAQTIFKSWFIDFDPVHAKANALANGQTLEQATQAAMSVISGKNTQELHRLQTANPEQYQQLWEIADAFPSGVDEEGVPWGWEERYLKDVCNIVYGKGLPKNKLTEKGFYVFGANGVIGFYDSYTYEKPQVLIGCRGTVGQVTLSYPYSFVTNNSLVIEYENSCVSMYY